MQIDSKQNFCPKKVGRSKGKENIIRSDHYPIILELKNIPKAKTILQKESRWNLKKPGGWEIYKAAMEEVATKMVEVTEDESLTIEDVMNKNEAIMNKVKFKAFGKSKPATQKSYEPKAGRSTKSCPRAG